MLVRTRSKTSVIGKENGEKSKQPSQPINRDNEDK